MVCQTGYRSAIAASALVHLGFARVANLAGGYDAIPRGAYASLLETR